MEIRKSECGVTLLYNKKKKAKTCFHRVDSIINIQQNKITRGKMFFMVGGILRLSLIPKPRLA